MYAITAANGQLGRLVIEVLLETIPASQIVAIARSPQKAADLGSLGIAVREGDYDRPETLASAFAGVSKVLLISSSEVGWRLPQHKAAIDAAKGAGVGLVAYTSILHADTSPAKLAQEHRATELALIESGLPHVLLRNGWYNENFLMALPAVLEHGTLIGSAGNGRFSAAARRDFAEAAAVALTAEGQAGKVYELAGDEAVTMSEIAAELSRQSGKPVAFQNLPEEAFKQALVSVGLPEVLADALADEDAIAADDTLFDDGRQLSRLIGHPTVSFRETVAKALAAKI
ncbi:SDR family oxidoreductase [Methylobacterium brachythecii]|uniref:NAD(P)-dependent oxidoreductase n=1 Tax=Methylobacterium brachythecii TaxID=1176177 RepID=A0A7W6F694_9HYPH|nr:SDR family oxidoreductase [Methylobacterium brachythecii]MBB3901761.1 NAD(P)H dehydrogenase (quinone) [Methylobacterium brachythecii]GLS43882.1 NAD(P)-dependent oxidoreductase [Methylobacterium brachythecii]